MKPPKREKYVTALKRARRAINDYQEQYICNALEQHCTVATYSPLIVWIMDLLKNSGNSFSLESWLLVRGYPSYGSHEQVRATRLAWIDWMIKEVTP